MPTKLHRLLRKEPWVKRGVHKEALCNWFASDAGQRLLVEEEAILERLMPDLFGLHCFVSGIHMPTRALKYCSIKHQFYASISHTQDGRSYAHTQPQQVITSLSELPFRTHSVDAAILMHSLDFETRVYQAVKEVGRIIIPGGSLVIVGFNPWSLWGMWRLMRWKAHERAPWCSNFISMYRVNDWLRLLDMDAQDYEGAFHFPSLPGASWLDELKTLKGISEKWASHWGGVYVLVAKKRPATLTPVRPKWRMTKPRFVPAPLAQASSRVPVRKNASSVTQKLKS